MFLEFLTIMLSLALLSMVYISCGKEDKDSDESNDRSSEITENDPQGTIIANLQNTFHPTKNGYYDGGIDNMNNLSTVYLGLNSSNNLEARSNNGFFSQIVSLGEVKNLSQIKKIPDNGWTNQVAAIPGYGYIYRSPYCFTMPCYEPEVSYARIYVVDYLKTSLGEIVGVTIKYQDNWVPESE